jgi:hypothetical protein
LYWSGRGKPQQQASLVIDPPNGRIPYVSEDVRRRGVAAPATNL